MENIGTGIAEVNERLAQRKNVRSLDEIADAIHKVRRNSIIEIGELLLEAKARPEFGAHGRWLNWLDEFEWSHDTAQRYMRVAELSSRFRKLRDLKLGATTLYALTDQDEADLPIIIAELAKHGTKKRLPPRAANRVIEIAFARRQFGDHPDGTLVALWGLEGRPYYEKGCAELLRLEPENDEAAEEIIAEVEREHYASGGDQSDHSASGTNSNVPTAATEQATAEKVEPAPFSSAHMGAPAAASEPPATVQPIAASPAKTPAQDELLEYWKLGSAQDRIACIKYEKAKGLRELLESDPELRELLAVLVNSALDQNIAAASQTTKFAEACTARLHVILRCAEQKEPSADDVRNLIAAGRAIARDAEKRGIARSNIVVAEGKAKTRKGRK